MTRMTLTALILLLANVTDEYNLDTKFPIIYKSSPGNYFGYTVALHKSRRGSFILVGSPQANSSVILDNDCGQSSCQVEQPGVLFKCNLPNKISSTVSCDEVTLYTKGNIYNEHGDEFSYYDKKDNMWLGVALDVNPSTNDVVICGHLWRNSIYKKNYLTNGVCYVIEKDFNKDSVAKLVPLTPISKQSMEIVGPPERTYYYYAFGQAGTSAAYSEDGKFLILGAPGLINWIGGVLTYPADQKVTFAVYSNPDVPYPPVEIASNAYLGYSVTSGNFFGKEMFYAIGAPRDNGQYGRVCIFKASELKEFQLSIHQKKEGKQFGEYFGATVLGFKSDEDTNTHLLVGAPLYSLETGGDEGKVYVFISNGVGLQEYAELMGDSIRNARFGTSIANSGDLNQDGYNDVAIGAPYEDGKGAVYIYHGSKEGINVIYTQKITAKEINADLSGFGIHISKGLDIDDNKYSDVLVGAYSSSNAVLFRTSPIIQLHPSLKFTPDQINTNLTTCEYLGEKLPCINITACLRYEGKHVAKSLVFENDIIVENSSQGNFLPPRGFFLNDTSKVFVITWSNKLEIGVNQCRTHPLYIYSGLLDVITPIEILYRYRLIRPSRVDKKFRKYFPVVHESTPGSITSDITFQTGCGNEDKCLSDLAVTAKFLGRDNKLILGEVSSVFLAIYIRNGGEPAYLTELLIHLPDETPPSISQHFCSSASKRHNASLVCSWKNPLLNGTETEVIIKLDVSKIPTNKKKLEILLEVLTASTEINPKDNSIIVPLELQAVADISILGVSSHEQILFDETKKMATFLLSHTYNIRNHGPSPIDVVDISLYVPISFKKNKKHTRFLTIRELETDSGKHLIVPAHCNGTYLNVKSDVPDLKAEVEDNLLFQNNESRALNNQSMESLTRATLRYKRSVGTSKVSVSKAQKFINCDTKDIQCVLIKCSASPFIDTNKFAQIKMAIELNVTALNIFLGSWFRAEMRTVGHIATRNPEIRQWKAYSNTEQVTTILVHKGPPPPEELAPWVVFVSIGVGIVLLLLILILLIRFGFFRRKQKEKMEQMLNEEKRQSRPQPIEGDVIEDDILQENELNQL